MTHVSDHDLAKLRDVAGRYRKLADQPPPQVQRCLCAWTDLLGFSTPLVDAGWEPDVLGWQRVAERVLRTQSVCWQNILPVHEYVLMLNDGIARATEPSIEEHLDFLSDWFRCCILTHCGILAEDTQREMPGARTVIAGGPRLRYSHEALTLDDFVFNYTKADPTQPGRKARMGHDPIVASNPGPLQMNLAFSKAYILDRGGSRWGLKGANIFIDESVFDYVRHVSTVTGIGMGLIDGIVDGVYRFALQSEADGSRYHLGFECDPEPIIVRQAEIDTQVWRLRAFYPCGEDVAGFRFEVC